MTKIKVFMKSGINLVLEADDDTASKLMTQFVGWVTDGGTKSAALVIDRPNGKTMIVLTEVEAVSTEKQ